MLIQQAGNPQTFFSRAFPATKKSKSILIMKIKHIIFSLCLFFTCLTAADAGELYICTDSDGREIITSLPKTDMKCELKETFQKPTAEEQYKNEYIKQQKARTEREEAIAEQEKANAENLRIRKPNEACERECKMDRGSCESDCARNTFVSSDPLGSYERTVCNTNCLNYQKTCIDRCYY